MSTSVPPSEIQWLVLLGGVLTVLTIITVALALARAFRTYVRELATEARQGTKEVSRKLDTGNGRAIGALVKDTANGLERLNQRIDALEALSETRNELLTERLRAHELEGHR